MNQINLYEQAIQHEIMLNPGLSREVAEATVAESPIDGFNFVMERLMKLMINLTFKFDFKFTLNTKYIGDRYQFEILVFDRENTLIYQSSIDYNGTDHVPNYSEFADKYLEELEPELKYFTFLMDKIQENSKSVETITNKEFVKIVENITEIPAYLNFSQHEDADMQKAMKFIDVLNKFSRLRLKSGALK